MPLRLVSSVLLLAVVIGTSDADLFANAGDSISGAIQRVCGALTSPDYACTCQPSLNGQGPFPVPPVKPAKPAGIFVQQAGQEPQFVATQPQGNNGPIVIQLKPQDINVHQEFAAAPSPPKIAAQGLTPPPAPAAPAAPAEEDLTALVFSGTGDGLITRCPVNHPVTWINTHWSEGGIRPYYEGVGFRASIEECKATCQSRDDCFFATLTPGRNCYLLTTTNDAVCKYHARGHFGGIGERCSRDRPCQSVYKRCGKPQCSLQSIIEMYCATSNKLRAVTMCHN